MLRFTALVVLAAAAQASATLFPAEAYSGHVIHETRPSHETGRWHRNGRVEPDAIVPVRIGLKQSNLEMVRQDTVYRSASRSAVSKHNHLESKDSFFALGAPFGALGEEPMIRHALTSNFF